MLGLLSLLALALALLIALLTAMLIRQMLHPPRHTAGYALAKGLPCDPSDLEIEFEQWTLDRPDGAKLPVWEISNPKSKIQNPKSSTAVFIHGWGHSRIDALARIEPFLTHFDRIILYDLRGHGDSTGSVSTLGDRDVQDLIALLERLGNGPFILIGHSMGAVIALASAAERTKDQRPKTKDDISAIIAYAPYCEFYESLQGRLRTVGHPSRPMTDLAMMILRLRGIRPLSLREQDLRDVHCPILIIHGSEDQVAPIGHARRIASAAPDATLHEIGNAAHLDAHQVDQSQHESLVRDFLDRISIHERATPQRPGIAMPGR
ncbi:MAG: alpha/beta hydrolase [Phycisphaerales bacterium]|nr:alpha/beta hydrolase [Phycisphaerales bacterium]MCI0630271.1 alpha/beta hydrolase [Phycisphaerales bacterium]MCI0676705.1 alpha/beta hydrolase [Phycisphaerales bacterium]